MLAPEYASLNDSRSRILAVVSAEFRDARHQIDRKKGERKCSSLLWVSSRH